MKLPIQYALAYPERLGTNWPRLDLASYPALTFEPPDLVTFPNLGLRVERGWNEAAICPAH
jgi:1-deoxy-D-xylulose-5-phosphate reductoisomerase